MRMHVRQTQTETKMSTEPKVEGKFFTNLKMNAKGIKETRARGIAEDACVAYKRQVEDFTRELRRLQRQREDLLDLHGDSALSIKPGKDFDPERFVEEDLELGYRIREITVRLRIAERQFEELFGDTETFTGFTSQPHLDEEDLPEEITEAQQ